MDEEVLENIEAIELQKIKVAMHNLYSSWNEIGIELEQKIKRADAAWVYIQNLVQDMVDDEISVCEEMKKNIRDYTEKISELSKDLSLQTSDVVGLTLLKRVEFLHQEFEALMMLKEKRLKELDDLKNLEKQYCLLLNKEECNLSFKTNIPSEDDLKEIQEYVNMLTIESNKRYKQYYKAGQDLIAILDILEIPPESTLEKHLYSKKEPFSLSDDTFRAIDEILAKANKLKFELENQRKNLMDKLSIMWERLNVENDKRLEFLSNHIDCKTSTLKAMEKELVRLEEVKRQNVHLFIDSVRLELEDLWEKCGASESEKLFSLNSSTVMTEDDLIAYEQEVEKWKKYYDKVKSVIEKIKRRNKLWEKFLEFENKASDPARFKNRGGNLLKEERERNKLHKVLPQLEKEICNEIEMYESKNNKKFFFLGEDYRCLISKQWEEHLSRKENIKKDKYLQVNSPSKFTTPMKRQPICTPKSAPCPRYKIYSSPLKAMPKTAKKLPISRPRIIKKKDQEILKEISRNKGDTSNNKTTYSEFATELNHTLRRNFRSTIVSAKKVGGTRTPCSVKKNRKSVQNMKTPEKELIDSAPVRGKAGLPFLM